MNEPMAGILPVPLPTSERRAGAAARSAGRSTLWRAVPALLLLVALAGLLAAPTAQAEDGYDLWLRYVPVEGERLPQYRGAATQLVMGNAPSATQRAARAELDRGLTGLLGDAPPRAQRVTRDGAIVLGTPASSPVVASLHLDLRSLGPEGYVIRSVTVRGHRATLIAANRDIGVLYGTFAFLRLLQTRRPVDRLAIESAPRIERRVLDHWDNLDGSVERGYAGASLWKWQLLPDELDPRYTDYARACASIGINGTVLTNVNASADVLAPL
ncbi:MAG: alpha-glucuronidase family glycosyl hydrolase, partial [Steroidobacteraceae bacterium]